MKIFISALILLSMIIPTNKLHCQYKMINGVYKSTIILQAVLDDISLNILLKDFKRKTKLTQEIAEFDFVLDSNQQVKVIQHREDGTFVYNDLFFAFVDNKLLYFGYIDEFLRHSDEKIEKIGIKIKFRMK